MSTYDSAPLIEIDGAPSDPRFHRAYQAELASEIMPTPGPKWPTVDGRPVYGPLRPVIGAITMLVHSMSAWAAYCHAGELAAQVAALLARPVSLQPNAAWCECPIGNRPEATTIQGRRFCPACNKPRVVRGTLPRPTTSAASRAVAESVERATSVATERRTEDTRVTSTPNAGITSPAEQQVTPINRLPARGFRNGDLVAGARTEASGVLIGWTGLGEMSRNAIRNALIDAGCPEAWAPATKSARAHAGRAVQSLAAVGVVPRAERGRAGRQLDHSGRAYEARWTVGRVDHGNGATRVGEAFGECVLTVTLRPRGILECDGDAIMGATVRAEYERTSGEELYPAGDVTDWLRGVMVDRFRAVRVGGNYYVRRDHADQAERLCNELALGHHTDARGLESNRKPWGTDWLLPALPVSTTDQLRQGLAKGLETEAADVLADLATKRADAKAQGKSEIGERAAQGLLNRLTTVEERAKAYSDVLGDDRSNAVLRTIREAKATIEPLCSDGAQRAAMLELYDVAKRG